MEIKITNNYQFCRNEQMKREKKRELAQKRHICLSNVVDSDFAWGYFYYAGRIERNLMKQRGFERILYRRWVVVFRNISANKVGFVCSTAAGVNPRPTGRRGRRPLRYVKNFVRLSAGRRGRRPLRR